MKNKYKLIALFVVLLFILFPMMNLFSQNNDDGFLNSDFIQNIVESAKEFQDDSFELTRVKLTKPETDRKFYNSTAVFKLQTDIKINESGFLGDGKYFSALFIDKDGVFDLSQVFFSEDNEDGYNPLITKEEDNKLQTFYGTQTGKHYLIGILSKEIPYFGNIYSNIGGLNPRARDRYVQHMKSELEEKKASVYVIEFEVNPNELD
ncbi:MAG: hypothetical protein ACOCV8_05205 [Spirochaetota bacterium]